MSKHLVGPLILFFVGALPCIGLGYMISVKRVYSLISGWDESKVSDPESYAKMIGGSVLGMGVCFALLSVIWWLQIISVYAMVIVLTVVSFAPIPFMIYANKKYKK